MPSGTTNAGLLRHAIDSGGQEHFAATALRGAAVFWFVVTVVGQMLFVFYIAAFYGGAAVQGDLSTWNKVLPHGYTPGDSVGNVAIGAHLLFAVVIIAAGALQLMPQVRRRVPAFHRWNGRVYVLLACVSSIIGLYMLWFRGGIGGTVQHIGMSGDAVLILLCAFMAVRHARARNFSAHRHWALRLFLVVSAVWFFRVGLMLSILVNHGPVGFDPGSFRGPFLDFLAFAQYLLPLAVLELFLRAQEWNSAAGRIAVAASLVALTVAMGIGIFGAAMGMWLPHM
ncbi:MAG: DUF2306 domain-containing protein [Pseudomonadota bacterium]